MRISINLFLLALCGILVYGIYATIKEPIVFDAALDKRESAVIKQLEKIRTAQEVYKRITDEYAANFDTLKQVLREGQIQTYKIIGDLDDESTNSRIDTLYTSAQDSIRKLGISIDSLDYVPYGSATASYLIDADTMTYQNTLVQVVEVGIKKKDYMGKYGDKRYQKYNNFYDPESLLKFGDMNSPNTSGNWKN